MIKAQLQLNCITNNDNNKSIQNKVTFLFTRLCKCQPTVCWVHSVNRMSQSITCKPAGAELRTAAAARITLENQVVCHFDWKPEEKSDWLLFKLLTTRVQRIRKIKVKWNQNPMKIQLICISAPLSFLLLSSLQVELHVCICIHVFMMSI